MVRKQVFLSYPMGTEKESSREVSQIRENLLRHGFTVVDSHHILSLKGRRSINSIYDKIKAEMSRSNYSVFYVPNAKLPSYNLISEILLAKSVGNEIFVLTDSEAGKALSSSTIAKGIDIQFPHSIDELILKITTQALHPGERMTENFVIAEVANELERRGYDVVSTKSTSQRGVDIEAIAQDGVTKILVEAKGETSSKPWSKRYRLGFNFNQKKDHIGKALLWVAQTRTPPETNRIRLGIAIPGDDEDRSIIDSIWPTLSELGVTVFLVGRDGRVEVRGQPLIR